MLKNHLKIAFRNLTRRKGFALINIIGLSLGLCCSLLIGLWLTDELGKDSFHVNGDRISQVMTSLRTEEGVVSTWESTGYPVGEALAEHVSEIESVVRITGTRESVMKVGGNTVGSQVMGADVGFFKFFTFPLIKGSPESCLVDLKGIVLSEKMANVCFPDQNPIGKTVELILEETKEPYLVTGVFKTLPQESTLQFDAVLHLDNFLPMNNKSWGNTWVRTYVLQGKNAYLEQLAQKLRDIPERIGGDAYRTLSLQPFKDRYLYSKFENGRPVGGRIDYVVLFGIIAVFTLLIACFNYINLTTAWSIKRSREVCIKKVLGAGKVSLLSQFFVESLLLVLLSVVVAVFLAHLSMPLFNSITGKALFIDLSQDRFYGVLAIISVSTVVLSGIYPAYSLASFKSTYALYEKINSNKNETALRKGLVVFQFFLCMAMIAGTVVVYLQLDYIQHKNLGLDKENILYMPMDRESYLRSKTLKDQLTHFSGVKGVSSGGNNFIDTWGTTSDPMWEGKNSEGEEMWFSIMDVDFGLLEMLNIKMERGRYFSPEFATDTLNYLVNEAALELMGLNDPIGKSMHFWGDKGGKIVGVVKNFHFASLHNPIGPMIIRCRPSNTWLVYVKTMPGRTQEVIAHMNKVHRQFSGLPFSYHFLDETIENGYKDELKVQKLASIFAALVIVISCLGLFGLAMFTANQRIKEIAVRKVLGANVSNLFRLLSKDYFKLVGIAMCLAVPISWYVLNLWVQNFAFHINIQWWMFVLAGCALLAIALFTISYQTLKVATTDPAKNLRWD